MKSDKGDKQAYPRETLATRIQQPQRKKLLQVLLYGVIIVAAILVVVVYFIMTSKKASEVDLQQANVDFTLDVYQKLLAVSKDKNLFVSPFSISAAVSMVMKGAKQETAEQLQKVLHVSDESSFHEALGKLLGDIKSAKNLTLEMANNLYLDARLELLDDYREFVKEKYQALVENVNFSSDANAAREYINHQVANATYGKIKDLLPPDAVGHDTELVIVSAIYFNSTWKIKFDTAATTNQNFHVNSKFQTTVPMMSLKETLEVTDVDALNATALLLPYNVITDSMQQEKLDYSLYQKILDSMEKKSVHLLLPRFKMQETVDLGQTLQSVRSIICSAIQSNPLQLGAEKLFSKDADLSGISANRRLKASKALHKAYVEVNERGTEAAAATGKDLC